MNEQNYIKGSQWGVFIASSLLIALLLSSWLFSGNGSTWKKYQREYILSYGTMADSLVLDSRSPMKIGVRQIRIPELNRTDRCISCHLGVEDPLMADAPQPYRTHPGKMLEQHPVEDFGCTICHGGQGRAMNARDAKGIDPGSHWDEPLLHQPYLQSSCGKCHLSIYQAGEELSGTSHFRAGHEIFSSEGCLGCHKARGVGGILGPDLSEQGEKTKHDYSFQNITTEQTVSNWLKEHFRDPEMVSPGSQMLKIDLPAEDIEALTTFVLGIARPDISFDYFSIDAINELKGYRKELSAGEIFPLVCSACHGKQGEGKDFEEFKTGVPAIKNRDFVRVASADFIEFTLLNGRSRRQMASWESGISGLSQKEIHSLALSIDQPKELPMLDASMLGRASKSRGGELFRELCTTCHGADGRGGLAPGINKPELLSNASDEFIFNTLAYGRGNTAMPSWSNLTTDQLHDLLSYLRSWGAYSSKNRNIRFADNDAEDGSLKFHYLCSRCHGEKGQGETGPAIINRELMRFASDQFLYNTIAEGRGHTAMFGWSTDVYNSERLEKEGIGNIIAFLRRESAKRPDYIPTGANPGDVNRGLPLFTRYCSECHGPAGEGTKAPAINNQEFLNAASNGYLMATITIGREGTAMPSWGKEEKDHPALTAAERQDIAAYIRSWQRIRVKY